MIQLGVRQPLMVVRKTEFGFYLGNEKESVLLPAKYAADAQVGDSIEVFVYRDSKARLIATTEQPYLTLGEVKKLKVKSVTSIGAFLDWGLSKDLFLPFKEQTVRVCEGRSYPVALYIDKSDRLCATMKLYPYLATTDAYGVGDMVKGTVYEYIDKFGLFVAVDDRFQGLIPKKAYFGGIDVGDEITARVTRVNPDGKIELAVRNTGIVQMDSDSRTIMEELRLNGGVLNLTDKSDPKDIERALHMSKAAFKRACGHLFKERKIQITDTCIKVVERS